jgi:signal transduction histidine kinase
VFQVVVGQVGFVGAPEQAVVDYIRSIYSDRAPPDLIMSVGGPAANFARKHRRDLFPNIPLMLASVDERYLRGVSLGENESAVPVNNDFPHVVDDILQVLPETRQVFMVVGSGALGKFWRRALEGDFKRFGDRVTFIWSNELSLQDILRRVASLPSNSAIFYFTFGTDALGGAYADEQVLADLHAKANAPMFGGLSSLFGHGIVGGSMMSIDELARNTADIASRILNGEPPANLRVPPQLPAQPRFDWRELQRWGIPESRLPPGAEVFYRSPSIWDAYRWHIAAIIAALILQASLITGLMLQRMRQRRADSELERMRGELAHVTRISSLGELSGSLGHELNQPLTAIVSNAQAAQRFMKAGGSDNTQEVRVILGDIVQLGQHAAAVIQRVRSMIRKGKLDSAPLDITSAVRDVILLLQSNAVMRSISVSLQTEPEMPAVQGDRIQLQQVVLNLLLNAFDAMNDSNASDRAVLLNIGRSDERMLRVSITDAGPEFPAGSLERVFDAFYTTKSNGLGMGLSISRSIVEAHGGRLWGESNSRRGATFSFTIPIAMRAESGPLTNR